MDKIILNSACDCSSCDACEPEEKEGGTEEKKEGNE